MITYKEMTLEDLPQLSQMYMETFNCPPWNDAWTLETASKRLHQMINVEDFYGLCAYKDNDLCGMILGSSEQFYDGVMFSIKEFCVRNSLRGQGIGSQIFKEFESRLKSQGVNSVVLFTQKGDGTEGFYQKRGMETYESMIMMGKQI